MNPANVFVRKCAIYTKYYISSSRYRIEKRRKMALHNELGTWGESLAADYLSRQGYTILERDWKSGHRDIDIIHHRFRRGEDTPQQSLWRTRGSHRL